MATNRKRTSACSRKTKMNSATGLPSYRGYEYQILATVWIGLELTTAGKTEAIIVEPPSEEDVAANLNVPAESAQSQVHVPNLQVQIKLRSNKLWKLTDFMLLLEGSPKKKKPKSASRVRPIEYLKQISSCRYLLLTNAEVDVKLRAYSVTALGMDSTATQAPGAKSVDPQLAKRIAILAGQRPDLLQLKINSILQTKYHVPGSRLDSCYQALAEHIRQRLLGTRANRFSSNEMQEVIRQHGGNVKLPNEPVHPSNFGIISEQLYNKHALVLVGPPGTGKTTLANSLMAKLETGNPPAQRVTVLNANEIDGVRRALSDPHDHIFYFEDPWGQDEPGAGATVFTSELPKLMCKAGPGKSFVITSRLGVFQQAVGARAQLFAPYKQELHPKDYDQSAYELLYDRQVVGWPKKHRNKANESRTSALKLLETPYSVEIFCQTFFEKIESGTAIYSADVVQIAKNSNVASFGAVLKDRIVAGGDDYIKSAIAIWTQLIVAPNTINGNDMNNIRSTLIAGGMTTPPDVLKLFNDLADARWFQPRSTGYVTTPSVRDALAHFEVENPAAFADTIHALFFGWLTEGAQCKILECVKKSKDGKGIVPNGVAVQFDAYLVSLARNADNTKFSYAFNDIAGFSKTGDPVAVLTRVLDCWEEEEPGTLGLYSYNRRKWAKPSLATYVVKDIRDHAEWFAKRFVTDYLPQAAHDLYHGYYYEPDDLLLFLGQFGWPIKEWFESTFEIVVKQLDDSTAFMAECLCKLDPSTIDNVFNSCLKEYQSVLDFPSNFDQEQYHKEQQGEVDSSPCGWHDDDGEYLSRAQTFLTTAMRIKRARDGYVWIQTHISAQHLLDSWADILEDINPVAEEFNAFVSTCEQCGDINAGLTVMRKHPDPRFSDWIINHLLECNVSISGRLLDVLKKYSLQPDFLRLLKDKIIALNLLSRIQVGWYIVQKDEELSYVLSAVLPYDEQRILFSFYDVSLFKKKQKGIQAKSEDLPKMKELVEGCSDIPSIYLLEVTKYLGVDITDKLARFLRSGDRKARECAWSLCEDRSEMLTHGTVDPEYRCRVAVLSKLAESATLDERQQLINLSNDPSAYVREAIARCIGINQWSEGISRLLVLIRDHREFGDQQHENDYRIYSVARAACNSLNRFQVLSCEILETIRNFLIECTTASKDSDVHGRLFRILARYPSEESMRFCSMYIKETWFKSKWSENRGRDLLVQCLHAIDEMLVVDPDLTKYLDFSNIEKVATWDNDEDELIGSALVVLGLTAKTETSKIDKLVKADSFSPIRARLLLALSESLQINRPQAVMQHIPPRDPFITLLDWATTKNRQPPYDSFSSANPAVAEWIKSLNKTDGVVAYEHWAVKHLIDPSGTLPEFSSVDLPHPYGFKES